jgi:hypothetical protein
MSSPDQAKPAQPSEDKKESPSRESGDHDDPDFSKSKVMDDDDDKSQSKSSKLNSSNIGKLSFIKALMR